MAVVPGLEIETVVVETTGDRMVDTPIHQMGGKGVFVKEVQAAVLEGRADLAVHSAKDLPGASIDELVLAAVPPRGDPRDALVGHGLDSLPDGATVATGSVRRRAQLSHRRPDLHLVELRGNIGTRLAKVGQFDAIVMAAAAIDRLGIKRSDIFRLSVHEMLPQVGQGALAVECRRRDGEIRAMLSLIEDVVSRRAVDAERAFLVELGGDCDLPAGAHAMIVDDRVELTAMLASLDGRTVLNATGSGADADVVGRSAARTLLVDRGGAALLGADELRP